MTYFADRVASVQYRDAEGTLIHSEVSEDQAHGLIVGTHIIVPKSELEKSSKFETKLVNDVMGYAGELNSLKDKLKLQVLISIGAVKGMRDACGYGRECDFEYIREKLDVALEGYEPPPQEDKR